MSATDDRAYAEVGRQMARWLAENDPHATPLADCAGVASRDARRRRAHRASAERPPDRVQQRLQRRDGIRAG